MCLPKRLRDVDPEKGAGSITIMFAGLMVALVVLAGLVFDGGAKMQAIEHANAAAEHAARTAAQQIDAAGAMSSGQVSLDPVRSVAAGDQVLSIEGVEGTVSVAGDEVVVVTTATVPTALLSIIGINEVSGDGRAVARVLTEDPQGVSP